MRRRLVLAIVALTLAGCATATPSAVPSSPAIAPLVSLGPAATPTPGATSSAIPTGSAAAVDCTAPDDNATHFHQVPELEALLPRSVAGRRLAQWSVRGRCWPMALTQLPAADIDQLLAPFTTATDLANLTYGVAGRSDTTADPPYFAFAAGRPRADAQIEVALYLLLAGGGFHDLAKASNLANYTVQTIGGKQVSLGTTDMVVQDVHQHGRPYLYQTDDVMFLVITDDDAWAADAISQLP